MAITYALPDIPVRASIRPRPSALFGVGAVSERPRNLTPYPDPLKKFPLSGEDPCLISNSQDNEGLIRSIEINFTPLPAALRRTPSAPAKKGRSDNNCRMEWRSSLPSSKGSYIDEGMHGTGKRRRGWIVPKEVIRDCLADLKRYVFVIRQLEEMSQFNGYDAFQPSFIRTQAARR